MAVYCTRRCLPQQRGKGAPERHIAAQWETLGGGKGLWGLGPSHLSLHKDRLGLCQKLGVSRAVMCEVAGCPSQAFAGFLSRAMWGLDVSRSRGAVCWSAQVV